SRSDQALAAGAGEHKWEEGKGEQHRVAGADEREQGHAEAGECEPLNRRMLAGAGDEPGPQREARGEERLAREPVEQQAVRREEDDRSERPAREPLEPAECVPEAVSYAGGQSPTE